MLLQHASSAEFSIYKLTGLGPIIPAYCTCHSQKTPDSQNQSSFGPSSLVTDLICLQN